jgi:SH3 domain-containing YSC84-like protein 1
MMWNATCWNDGSKQSTLLSNRQRNTQERYIRMMKHSILLAVLVAGAVVPALAASNRDDDTARIRASARVFREIMNTPDKAIPKDLLESAKCIAIIPGEKKAAFIFGGNYGKGLATCRTEHGWSAPLFLAVGGGSWGLQLGGSSTDVIMIIRSEHGIKSLLSDKFKIGADATAAAGPVGRQAAADTDVKLNAEILTYSRSKGAFAGVSLDGAVVQADRSGDEVMYGANVERKQILDGAVAVPAAAQPLIRVIGEYAGARGTESARAR